MIEKMKKLTFLVTNKEYEGFLENLRELGVVHIQQLQEGASSPQLQTALDEQSRYNQALQSLETASKTYELDEVPVEDIYRTSPAVLLRHVEDLQTEDVKIQHEIDAAQKNVEVLEPWGEFNPESVARLAKDGNLQIFFWRSNTKFFNHQWEEEYFATPISEFSKNTYFITFSKEKPDIHAEQIFLPSGTLNQYQIQLDELNTRLDALHGELLYINNNLHDIFEKGETQARNEIQLRQVRLSDERVAGDALRLLIGWVRADKADQLTAYLDGAHIFYEMEDPDYNDDVPIQISNGSYTRLFEPILMMYSLPNYHDIDPSVFFAPFFMLFFGLCLGDGGYGLLVLIAGIIMARKCKGDMQNYGRLAVWLGLMTVICGLLTGTVFGIDLTQQDWAILAPVKPYFLNENGIGPIFGYSPLMVISVFIGLVQVLLGMVLKGCKAVKNYGLPYSISTFSWVFAILSALALFGLPACGVAVPLIVQYVLYGVIGVSVLGIFLYNNPGSYKKPALGVLSNLGGGIWATYGMATGLLGDLLSYIRLFALGLTGGVLGGVFNSLAYNMTESFPWFIRWLPMVIILLAGHGITFALSLISAFVHPMRLTFVEFFKNANFEGGGKAYNPFRIIKDNKQ